MLCGRFPAIVKQAWGYLISGDPAWYWVVNIIVATIVAVVVNYSAQKLRIQKFLAIVVFVFALLAMESFAWHGAESIELIKNTTVTTGFRGVIATAVSAIISFIIHVSGIDYGEDG